VIGQVADDGEGATPNEVGDIGQTLAATTVENDLVSQIEEGSSGRSSEPIR
jgi:hypothetical protein